jgi:hypothetical protein
VLVLDPRTLVVESLLVSLCLAAAMVGVSALRRVPRGFGAWTLAQVAYFLGGCFVAARGAIPLLASVLVGNLLLLLGHWLMVEGFVRFHGLRRRIPAWVDGLLLLLAAAYFGAAAAGPASPRIVAWSLASAWLLLRMALAPLASAAARRSAAQRILSGVYLAGAAVLLVRLGWVSRSPPVADLWREGWTAVVPGLVLTIVNTGGVLLALYLTFERSESGLRAALAEVKTLTGLLPICMHCHSIRNDRGYWDRLELYLGDHSDAQFSHGICPDCFTRLYPGLGPPPGRGEP